MTSPQNILFLQSHPSSFAPGLASALRAYGAEIHKVHFTISDSFYWPHKGAIPYRGRLKNWRVYLERLIDEKKIDAIVYFADRRPYHRVAAAVARERGIPAYVYELGYLRPDWLTLEHSGMGAYSHVPNDPEKILTLASDITFKDPDIRFPHRFRDEAIPHTITNIAPHVFPFPYPFFQNDRYYDPFLEHIAHLKPLITNAGKAKRAAEVETRLIRDRTPYFLIPLQLQLDYQIRAHSRFAHIYQMIDEVLKSFAGQADKDHQLLFKIHPLDNDWENYESYTAKKAAAFGVEQRITVIKGGNLDNLIDNAIGTIVINSTVGLQSIQRMRPTLTLGSAIYDVDGLTFQSGLDKFWHDAEAPDKQLTKAFIDLIGSAIHIKGNFFSKDGCIAAIPDFAERIYLANVNSHGAYEEIPPRLAKAHANGMPLPADTGWTLANLKPDQ